jgi:hypothetical protein
MTDYEDEMEAYRDASRVFRYRVQLVQGEDICSVFLANQADAQPLSDGGYIVRLADAWNGGTDGPPLVRSAEAAVRFYIIEELEQPDFGPQDAAGTGEGGSHA